MFSIVEYNMVITYILAFITLGFFTGILSGLMGIGGGLVMVPLLVFLFDFQQKTANGISLVAMLLPVGLLAVWQYYRDGYIQLYPHIQGGLLIGLGIFFGAWTGAKLASIIPSHISSKLFAILLVVGAIKLWFYSNQTK
jgi:uncharacterized membrane protein YfcA